MSRRRAFIDRFTGTRPGPPRGAIIFDNQVGTHPVLVEIRSPIVTVMDVIHIRDPTDFNYDALINAIQAHATTSSAMFRPLAAGTPAPAPRILAYDLKVSWNLGNRATTTGVLTDGEFRRVFAMMSYRGWRDHFMVRIRRDNDEPILPSGSTISTTNATIGGDSHDGVPIGLDVRKGGYTGPGH